MALQIIAPEENRSTGAERSCLIGKVQHAQALISRETHSSTVKSQQPSDSWTDICALLESTLVFKMQSHSFARLLYSS